jgi:hypothetical protein
MELSEKNKIKREWHFCEERSATTIKKYIFFVLWPFGAWLYALKSANTKSSLIIFFLFSCLICWHFAPTGYNDRFVDFLWFYKGFELSHYTISDIAHTVWDYVRFSSQAPKELYIVVSCWFVKLFTNNYHFYFLLCAVPVTLAQLGVVKRIVLDKKYTNCIAGVLLLTLLVFQRDIFAVQNPRFCTGFWICVLFSIKYYTEGRRWQNILPILFAPLIHSAMWVYLILFLCGLCVEKQVKALRIIALCSIPFVFLDLHLFNCIDASLMPGNLQKWVATYTSDESYQKYVLHAGRAGFWWVRATFDFATEMMFIIMTLMLIKKQKYVMESEEGRQLYSFYLFLFAAVNMVQFVPVLGARFGWFVRVFCLYVWYKSLYGIGNYKWVLYLLLGASSWEMLIRYGYLLGGTLSVTTPVDLFFTPLPYLLGKGLFW